MFNKRTPILDSIKFFQDRTSLFIFRCRSKTYFPLPLSCKMLSQVCFEQIKENYWYGLYGDFRVVMDRNNGYVNATKLCTSGGKQFYKWSRNESSQQLMQTLQILNVDKEALPITHDDENALQGTPHQIWREVCKYIQTENKTDTDRLISGTYIHPDLVPSVAGWISPLFQLKANRVVNGYIMEEWKAKLDASELNANHLLLQLQTSDAIIDNLQCSLEEKDALISVNDINEAINQQRLHAVELQNEELQQARQALQEAIHDLEFRNDALASNIEDCEDCLAEKNDIINVTSGKINMKNEIIANLGENVVKKIADKQKWASTHAFSLLRVKDLSSMHPYYGIRCQRGKMSGAITKLRRRHPAAEVIYHQNKIPNAVNLFTRLREAGVLDTKRNYCVPKQLDEQALIARMAELCGTTHTHSNVLPFNVYMAQ